MLGLIAFALYVATIPFANWMIGNVGTICIPDGPCMIPVGFGMLAPSGVLMVGAALILRDIVQREFGWHMALVAIFVGAGISALVAPPALVIASVAAFLFSEAADLAVYTPLQRKNFPVAIALSGVVGAVIDSAIFLYLAFGNLDHIDGQIWGKASMSIAAGVIIGAWRWRRAL